MLAGGMVLGLGASATLAAWTDSSYSSADFTAGTFEIELNAVGQWTKTTSMTFTPGAMFPDSVRYSSVQVRTTVNSTYSGTVTLTGRGAEVQSGGIADHLEYRAVTLPAGTTCSESSFTTGAAYVLGTASAWVPMRPNNQVAPSSQVIPAGGANPVNYCFAVRLRSNAPSATQGTTASHTWVWNAISSSSPGA